MEYTSRYIPKGVKREFVRFATGKGKLLELLEED
jgi:hypothetical protein